MIHQTEVNYCILVVFSIYENNIASIFTVPQIGPRLVCPGPEFRLWKGQCYSFHHDELSDWWSARDRCWAKSTFTPVSLLNITSLEEAIDIRDAIKDCWHSYWIGDEIVDQPVDNASGGRTWCRPIICYLPPDVARGAYSFATKYFSESIYFWFQR